jgi:hypothetical protein|tara:strand:+ start:235 stop:942 length:708 start_codon:yes stop_codon:yes gene_type:complete
MNLFDLFSTRNYEKEPRDQRDSISSAFGDYGPERFNPGKYPWERGPGAPMKQEGQSYWNKDRVGVEPMFGTAETGREQAIRESDYAQPPQTLFDQAKDLGGQALDHAGEFVTGIPDYLRNLQEGTTPVTEADANKQYRKAQTDAGVLPERTESYPEYTGDYPDPGIETTTLGGVLPYMLKDVDWSPYTGYAEPAAEAYKENVYGPIEKYFAGGAGQRIGNSFMDKIKFLKGLGTF